MRNFCKALIFLTIFPLAPCMGVDSSGAISNSISQERNTEALKPLFKKLEMLEASLRANIDAVKAAEASVPPADALIAENAFLDSKNAEILKAIAAFENVGIGRSKDKYSLYLEDSTKAALRMADSAFKMIFEPLKPRKISVEIPSEEAGSLKTTEGMCVRVGPVVYFSTEDSKEAFAFSPAGAKKILSVFGKDKSKEISEYIYGKSEYLPLPQSLKGDIKNLAEMSVWERIEAGGIWMAPILFFGVLALLIALVKSVKVAFIKRADDNIAGNISEKLEDGNIEGALKIARNAPSPYSAMLLSLVKRFKNGTTSMEESAYEHMLIEGGKLHRGMGLISITATVAPLLGLLGTVTGIIKTFGNISEFGTGNAGLMSQGIGEALITTEFGLMVAIPAFVIHALLSRKIKAVLSDMEKLASGILNAAK